MVEGSTELKPPQPPRVRGNEATHKKTHPLGCTSYYATPKRRDSHKHPQRILLLPHEGLVDSVHLWSNLVDKQTPNDRNPTISVIGTSHLLQLPHLGYLEYLLDTDHRAELEAKCSAPPWLCCWVHVGYLLMFLWLVAVLEVVIVVWVVWV